MLAAHMTTHIVAMNVAAPILAMLVSRSGVAGARIPQLGEWVGVLGIVQIGLLWGWHAPPVLLAAMGSPGLAKLMHASLFAAAFVFWLAVVDAARNSAWRALLSLLLAGKLFCLLGIILTFSPRPLYGQMAGALADQQLAGLLMLVACPATFVLAGIIVAARWLHALDRRPGWTGRPERPG